MEPIWIAVGVLGFLLFVCIVIYNGLVTKKNQVEYAWSGIDVQLKKRYDLIPNLVAVVKGYTDHERKLLERIVELRGQALKAPEGSAASLGANGDLSLALRGLSVAIEKYPNLKADEQFLMLQRNLSEVEEQLSAARRTFNSAVTDYNNATEQVPSSFFASMMGYTRKSLFEVAGTERESVPVGNLLK